MVQLGIRVDLPMDDGKFGRLLLLPFTVLPGHVGVRRRLNDGYNALRGQFTLAKNSLTYSYSKITMNFWEKPIPNSLLLDFQIFPADPCQKIHMIGPWPKQPNFAFLLGVTAASWYMLQRELPQNR